MSSIFHRLLAQAGSQVPPRTLETHRSGEGQYSNCSLSLLIRSRPATSRRNVKKDNALTVLLSLSSDQVSSHLETHDLALALETLRVGEHSAASSWREASSLLINSLLMAH